MKNYVFVSILFITILFSGCVGGNEDAKFKACFETWLECSKKCDEIAKKAWEDYRNCTKEVTKNLRKAKAECDEKFPEKCNEWAECWQNAMNKAEEERAACAEKRRQQLAKAEKCRTDCIEAFKKCTGWQ